MSNNKIKSIKSELEEIKKQNGGFLRPEDVVEYARNKNTALHKRFDWDDNTAAHKYRLKQAGYIIREVKVTIESRENKNKIVEVRKYVSLPKDRTKNGGYREIKTVLSEYDLRLQYIESVESEFNSIKYKIKGISKAADIISEKLSKEIVKEKNIVIKKIQTNNRATDRPV